MKTTAQRILTHLTLLNVAVDAEGLASEIGATVAATRAALRKLEAAGQVWFCYATHTWHIGGAVMVAGPVSDASQKGQPWA